MFGKSSGPLILAPGSVRLRLREVGAGRGQHVPVVKLDDRLDLGRDARRSDRRQEFARGVARRALVVCPEPFPVALLVLGDGPR